MNVVQTFGGNAPYWGYSESPLIVGDRIVLNAGGRRASIVAIDKAEWQDAVAEPRRRGRRIRRRCCCERAVCAGRVLHRAARARGRSARRPAAVELQPKRRTTPPTSRRRSSAARACSSRRTTAPARRCSTSRRRATSRRRRGVFHARDAQPSRELGARRRHDLWLLEQHPHGAQFRHRSDGVAKPQRRERFADLRRRRLYLYSENGDVGLAEAAPDGYRERGRFSIDAVNEPRPGRIRSSRTAN